jgi:hypothetical protein
MRFIKLLIGIGLLPLCAAATLGLADLIGQLAATPGRPDPGLWWLAGGFVLWLILFIALPRPVRTYVLAHELTHAFWGLMMGARVSRLKVSKRGGSVTLSKTNFLITLAPYFFPFYTMLSMAVYAGLSLFVDLSAYEPFWLGVVGLTWSFHLTFTIATLMQHQPDIAEHGRVFSYAVIYLFNLLGIGLWIVGIARPTLTDWSVLLIRHAASAYAACWDWANTAWAGARDARAP